MSKKGDILQRDYIKSTLPEMKLYNHGCYIHQYGRDLMDMLLDYISLLLIVDMKTINKWRSVEVLCTSVSLFGS